MFPYLPLAALAAIALLVIALRRRGIRAVIIDHQRPAAEQAFETAAFAVLVSWVYLVIDYASPPGPRWLPAWLDNQLFDNQLLKWLGAALLAAGVGLFVLALVAMSDSWRMGIDYPQLDAPAPVESGGLITRGVFNFSRNPIYVAFHLVALGTLAIHGRAVFLLAAIALAIVLHIQIRREEHSSPSATANSSPTTAAAFAATFSPRSLTGG